jgi:hypothetical protein
MLFTLQIHSTGKKHPSKYVLVVNITDSPGASTFSLSLCYHVEFA